MYSLWPIDPTMEIDPTTQIAADGIRYPTGTGPTTHVDVGGIVTEEELDDALDGIVAGASGPAGGVLGGTYPNPGFAVDMATQAELGAVDGAIQTELDTKAPINNPTFTGNVVVPDADAATEALNRQTGDARYQAIGSTESSVGSKLYLAANFR